ncbi:MAG TPA: ATP-binding cassette domain-containing protein [Candidatus Binatia bacterium]|jgi:ABC-type transporter Mla maintaining outer membrane lipid asymmetry ATPase subunit MlaF|nr:ATP-binding cassette domain-containing protein [Candidatus Binatia bacterium]
MEQPAAKPEVTVIRMERVAVSSMQDPETVVAEDINWTVQAGAYWVIGGLQGSGKSDFLMMTGGVIPPLRGRYRLFGEEMPIFDDARLQVRLRLGLVFDGGQLFNHLTVRENVALPLRYHRNLTQAQAEPEVRAVLEAMDLMPWADSTPGALGRNWQKRVGMARALMLKPEVLLVDNPLGGLDLRHMQWWLGFLGQLSKGHGLMGGRPVTLVLTTADLRPWKGRAHQFAVLKDRRWTLLGNWEQLEAASGELVQELLTVEQTKME